MSVDLSQFIPSFLEESFEGLELMEASLLTLEAGDNETIDSIFRAAHSIKGGAGTFGFNKVTEFTHLVETLLDEMRDGRREITDKDTELLLISVDCMRLLIKSARDDADYDENEINKTTSLLTQTLATETSSSNNDAVVSENNAKPCKRNIWHISFIPEHHLVQTGNDPLLLFNALAELGELTVIAKSEDLPALDDMDVEELYLSWELTLVSDVNEEDIREIFEWVEDECILEIELDEPKLDIDEPVTLEALDNPLIIDNTLSPNSSNVVLAKISSSDTEPSAATEKNKTKSKQEAGSIRVGVDKIDSLINLVGELVITQSMLSELGNDFQISKLEKLTSGLEQLLQNTKELQESVMKIRMLPISFVFNRFPRLVHDLSLKTDKKVELIIRGEQTELDKTVMEQIGDPLVHLVRNAVDHGIEYSNVRLANGKSESGSISLNAFHQGGNIVIEISDDGGGINREAVLNKAIEKGLIDNNATLTDSQVFDLLFEPGFSTAKEVSDISGRGVGMDVVKRNIQSLGGRIQVESQEGKGSKFKVILPLTLAILDGQLVRVGTEVYIIPLITIVESLQAKPELINRVSGGMIVYRLREDNVPVIPIYQLFNLLAETKDVDNALLVVVEADGQKIGLMVDDLLAQQQVVIKSLKDNYQQVSGISGATILGDGSVAMILDIPSMIAMAMKRAKKMQNKHHMSVEGELV
jgi:two-component system chemotaxis sensor kinase CheA